MYYLYASKVSPKMSNSTCFTKPNPNLFLCRRAKRARKFQIIVVLPRQILMYYCLGKQSEPNNVKQYLFYQAKSIYIFVQASKVSQKIVVVLVSQILMRAQKFRSKRVLNYQLSNASPKMSHCTCFTKLNPNTFLCRRAKRAKKFQIVVVLVSQILMYYLQASKVSPKMSNITCFTKPNPNILFCRRVLFAKKI